MAQVKDLQQALNDRDRASKQRATPFSKNAPKPIRKKPGRKRGEGLFRCRIAPDPADYSEPVVDVPVRGSHCSCGGDLVAIEDEIVTNTDLPPNPKPIIKAYRIQRKRCSCCGKKFRGRHPEVAKDQRGATAHRLGERIFAVAHILHYGVGVTVQKVPEILKTLGGVDVTQGALTRDALARSKAEVGAANKTLREGVKNSNTVNTDDTGWKVDGVNAQLMVFETQDSVIYQVRAQHRNVEVREIVPGDYEGTMGTDRGRSYDAKELEGVDQQKCIAHIQRNLTAVLERNKGAARWFPQTLKDLLHEANELWKAHKEEPSSYETYIVKGKELEARLTEHLRPRNLTDPDNQRLLNELGRHHDRGNLVRFLSQPEIEPTNNRAERALRPAVIARKVSQCSKNWRGAEAFAAFKSVIQTLKKRGKDVVESLVDLFRGRPIGEVFQPP